LSSFNLFKSLEMNPTPARMATTENSSNVPTGSSTPLAPSISLANPESALPILETFKLRSRQVFVSKIFIGITKNLVADYFSQFGVVEDVDMIFEDTDTDAYVTFTLSDSVKDVLKHTQEGRKHFIQFLNQDYPIIVNHAFSPSDLKTLQLSLKTEEPGSLKRPRSPADALPMKEPRLSA